MAMEKGAIISDDQNHRYRLWRVWDASKASVMFIMLNPSTADAERDDATIKRCIGFAKSWGYGGIYVGNLYSYRTKSPKELKAKGQDNFTMENIRHTIAMAKLCEKVILAWGNNWQSKSLPMWINLVGNQDKFYYLELSKTGAPKHPLYLSGDIIPNKYEVVCG